MANFKCSHCRLSFDESSAIVSKSGDKFCCTGCKNVYEVLHSSGFDEFYSRLGKNTLSPQNIVKDTKQSIQSLYDNYVKDENGFKKINLVIDGIHCSACIWLNEKVLFATNGVVEASINSTNNKATIVWDEEQVNLAEILSKINAVGYRAYAYDALHEEAVMNAKRRDFYIKLLVGVFCVMNIMWIAIAQYAGYFSGIDKSVRDILNYAEFILATPVLFYTGSAFFVGASIAIKTKTPNMDLLVITGATLAYIYSIYSMFSRVGEVYFDSVAMIITFVFIGKFLEVLSKKRANDTLDGLNFLILSQVNVITNNQVVSKSVHDVKIGDIVILKAGDRALVDGVIISGEAGFDLSSLSGESLPLCLGVKDEIKSGAICLDGVVEYEVKASFENSLLNKIILMLENAVIKKPRIEQLANEISSKFSFVILSIAAITFGYYFLNGGFENALVVAISVIVIACPCALALATPVATLSALGVGLKHRVIFKESKFIETLAKCDIVVFDKTGTLTNANLKVKKFVKFKDIDDGLILALASASKHPVSVAVANFLSSKTPKRITDIKEVAAKGVSASFNGQPLLGGSARFMCENGVKTDDGAQYFVCLSNEIVAKFELEDELKSGIKECIDELKRLNMGVFVLSGDSQKNVKKVADELGASYKAQVLPDEKAYFVQDLVKNGHRVVFVGDGINDSVAMTQAQIAVCMGSGADISLQKSDVALLNDDINAFCSSVRLSKKTLSIIKQNLVFSLCYNAFTIPLAVLGYVMPLFAALSMSLSSLVVILNSLRIKR